VLSDNPNMLDNGKEKQVLMHLPLEADFSPFKFVLPAF
jgi:hypothetical protein